MTDSDPWAGIDDAIGRIGDGQKGLDHLDHLEAGSTDKLDHLDHLDRRQETAPTDILDHDGPSLDHHRSELSFQNKAFAHFDHLDHDFEVSIHNVENTDGDLDRRRQSSYIYDDFLKYGPNGPTVRNHPCDFSNLAIGPSQYQMVQRGPNGPISAPASTVVSQAQADAECEFWAWLTTDADAEPDAACVWRRRYRTAINAWLSGRTLAEARRIAWGLMQRAWHREHGPKPDPAVCAECGGIVAGHSCIEIDGAMVHADGRGDDVARCLMRYAGLWRGAADKGLLALGLQPPPKGAG